MPTCKSPVAFWAGEMNYSSSALGLGAVTLQVIQDFCTPRTGAPDCARGSFVDEDLRARIRHTTHCATMDYANNEVTAVQDMSHPLVTEAAGLMPGDVISPCRRLTVRDKAH
eukprot:2438105-Alexandrium_andersonii.AAC.1